MSFTTTLTSQVTALSMPAVQNYSGSANIYTLIKIQNNSGGYIELLSNSCKGHDGYIDHTFLDLMHVLTVHIALQRKSVLAQTSFFAFGSDALTQLY